VHARSLAEVAISSQQGAIGFYTYLVLEAPARGWVFGSWKQIARAKKIFWKGGRRRKSISIEVLKDKNRHRQSDK